MKARGRYIWIGVCLAALAVTGCERSYFFVSEDIAGEEMHKFTLHDAYYMTDRRIELTGGKYLIASGDSTVLFVTGGTHFSVVEEKKVAGFDITERARFYMMLPPRLKPGSYTVNNQAICEIVGNILYKSGENLFVCESGQVTIDSVDGRKLYGMFSGRYINTSNNQLNVEGPFQADWKKAE